MGGVRAATALVVASTVTAAFVPGVMSAPRAGAAPVQATQEPQIIASVADPARGTPATTVMRHVDRRHAQRTSGTTTASTSPTAPSDQLASRGGTPAVVSGPPKVYLVLWGSQWGSVTSDAQGLPVAPGDPLGAANYLARMYASLGTGGETWSGVLTQYCAAPSGATVCASSAPHVGYPTGGALAGWWADTSTAAPSIATSGQVASEAQAAAVHFANTTTTSNADAQYVIVSPTGTHPEGFAIANPSSPYPLTGACASHSFATSAATGDLVYTDLPYVTDLVNAKGVSGCGTNSVNAGAAGALDGFSIVAGHEYAETVTDPDPGLGWLDSSGLENGDKCAWTSLQNVTLGTSSFAMQPTWSNSSASCAITHSIVTTLPTTGLTLSALPAQVAIASPGTPVTTTITGSAVGTDTLSISVQAPQGFTVSLSATQIQGTGSTTMAVSTDTTVVAGNYDLMVTTTSSAAGAVETIDVPATVTPGAFAISLTPAIIEMTAGTLATAQIQTQTVSGAPQWLYFSLLSQGRGLLPAHVFQTVTVGPVVSGQASVQEFWSDPTAKAGTYHYLLRAMSAQGVIASTPLTLQVLAAPSSNFTPSLSARQGATTRGSSTPATVTLKLKKAGVVSASTPPATVAVTGLPAHVTAQVSPSLAVGRSTPVTFSADAQAVPGTYIVTIECTTAGGVTRSATFLLYVI